mmetsp:Transcript_24728/g.41817  ORF Transcript_24728/g.41817 Transcript_24728/m.41817 type:complete len:204 (-) Transcript_24728:296-907(-)|eukprot:CAMPEP_0114423650 /NCGR_PEP_ID=MMETSP0103-20121206/6266_1 /TAXON_ID=37642 ORGANISM="Paraphysomonas imperforata, Strain PA2" /NCGR_SAMPLE_ID=MMETSP0103 /ASSEMBLY_ACC=CAM_ASM_000201 /LENGTH=203 /DNA_ID=CAMNT_0001592335 /DNA_START=42 /DNA_END=653 /DNA_ORIENTATION=+
MTLLSVVYSAVICVALVATGAANHDDVITQPIAEAFGKWTTGAYRAGKSKWVGDETIDHGGCDNFRFNTLGIRSVIQSPSDDSFNALVEISHPKRKMQADMSFINVTLSDKNGDEWHFHRDMFENSDVISHLELPQANADGIVWNSDDNFRFIVSIDFDTLNIPASMENTVEISVYSYRPVKYSHKLDAVDCVKLSNVGIVSA